MRRKWSEVIKHKYFYLMVLPTVLFFLIFAYVPMYGVVLAFKDFNYMLGIMEPMEQLSKLPGCAGGFEFLACVQQHLGDQLRAFNN